MLRHYRSSRISMLIVSFQLASLVGCGNSTAPTVSQQQSAKSATATIIRHSVSSSAIRSVGYDEASQTLEVEFPKGEVYRYSEVPASVYREMLIAPSIGHYFHANVRNKFSFVKCE